ncbi:hypothetical protein J1614_005003 [Plenodomus biglobosus]|nr:hypothetical protein J1614_005003 [Plenodomus biglobosus]
MLADEPLLERVRHLKYSLSTIPTTKHTLLLSSHHKKQSAYRVLIMNSQKESNSLRPEPRRLAPPRSSVSVLGNLMADAQRGHKDFISREQMEANRRKKEAYERSHGQSKQAPELPSLQALQRLGNALRDGSAFKGDSHRPHYCKTFEDEHGSKQTHRQTRSYPDMPPPHTPTAYHVNVSAPGKSNRMSCQVSLCEHEHYAIDWVSSDPDNTKGSWIGQLRYYWDHSSSRDDHKKCQRPNNISRCKTLAERIIAKYMANEQSKLPEKDRQNGAAIRPPSFERIHREVQILYSHLFRGNAENIIEKKEEAARKEKHRDILRRKQTDGMKQREELVKGSDIDDMKENEKPVMKSSKKRALEEDDKKPHPSAKEAPNKKQKMSAAASEEVVKGSDIDSVTKAEKPVTKPTKKRALEEEDKAASPGTKEAPNKKQKVSAAAEDRFKLSSMAKRKERAAKMAENLTQSHAAKAQKVTDKQLKKTVSPKQTKVTLVESDLNEDIPTATEKSAPQASQPNGVKKEKKKNELTTEERKLLKGMQQAEVEENEAYVPEEVEGPEEQFNVIIDDDEANILAQLAEKEKQAILIASPAQKVAKTKALIPRKTDKEIESAWNNFDTALQETKSTSTKAKEDSIDNNSDDGFGSAIMSELEKQSQPAAPPPPKKHKFPNKRGSRLASLAKANKEASAETTTPPQTTQKSAPIIDNSDDETNYALPVAKTELPSADLSGEFEAETKAIVQDIVHRLEQQTTAREEILPTTEEDNNIPSETNGESETSPDTSMTETQSSIEHSGVEDTTTPATPPSSRQASPAQKRKRSSSDEEMAPLAAESAPQTKKVKIGSTDSLPGAVAEVTRKRSATPPCEGGAEEAFKPTEEAVKEVGGDGVEEAGSPDSLDSLFGE